MILSRKSYVVSRKYKGFTLIELIMTIVVIGILMIPLALMSLEFTKQMVYSRDSGVAGGLAKVEMAKINNLSYSDATLAVGYDNTTADYEGYSYSVRRTVTAGPIANLKQVQVRVYASGNAGEPLANLITYLANAAFGAGSGGGAVSGGDADNLVVSGGSISGSNLQNITMENTGGDSVTITGVTITFNGTSGIKLKTISMGGSQRWSGTENSGSTITLDTSFTMAAGTTYANTGLFTFSKNLGAVSSLIFIMSDASESESYSW